MEGGKKLGYPFKKKNNVALVHDILKKMPTEL